MSRMGSGVAAARVVGPVFPLYVVTIRELDGNIKTVVKTVPMSSGVISCYELKREHLNALWLPAQREFLHEDHEDENTPSKKSVINVATKRRIAFFACRPPIVNHCVSKGHAGRDLTLAGLLSSIEDDAIRKGVGTTLDNLALAINTPEGVFIPPNLESVESNESDKKPDPHKTRQAALSVGYLVLDAALNNDKAFVEMMLAKNPGYLFYRGSATDFAGRKYSNITLFQAALFTRNYDLFNLMLSYIDKLPGEAKDNVEKQFLEVYPQQENFGDKFDFSFSEEEFEILGRDYLFDENGDVRDLDGYARIYAAYDSTQRSDAMQNFKPKLDAVLEAVKVADDSAISTPLSAKEESGELGIALSAFRDHVAALSMRGEVFNPYYVLVALSVVMKYSQQFSKGYNSRWDKLDLLWCKVIGYLQRFLSDDFAEEFGVALAAELNQLDFYSPISSSKFGFIRGGVVPFQPNSGLGYDFAWLGGDASYTLRWGVYGGKTKIQSPLSLFDLLHGVFKTVVIRNNFELAALNMKVCSQAQTLQKGPK